MPRLADIDAMIKQARKALQAGNLNSASGAAQAALTQDPDNRDALYIAAVCARYDHRHDDALGHLARLKAVIPEFGRAYQEEGHLRRQMDAPEAALEAYRRATRDNPALIASWNAQAELLAAEGHADAASACRAQAQRLSALPRELLAVTNHVHEGRIVRAEDLVRAFLKRNPTHVEAMRLLADIGVRLGVHEDAHFLLERAIELEPENIQLRLDFVQVLRKQQRFSDALDQARWLAARDPGNPVFLSHFAIQSMQAGDYETALDTFEKVLALVPDDPATLTSRGHALKTYGKTYEAIASYQAATRVAPQQGDAWYGLANLKTYRFSDAELGSLSDAATSGELDHMSRIHVAFARAKALEERGRFDEAFACFAQGNALKKQTTRYTTGQMLEEFAAQKAFCTQALFDARSAIGCNAPDPIFILGLPRAGSTLIEQVLASHPGVDGTLELPNILALSHRLRGRQNISDRERYPRILQEMPDAALSALGQEYIDTTRIHRQDAPFFTDKMPNNFRHIGLIHLILPNARIIDARRNAMDCCWSGYKQLFAEGQEFTYGLETIGQYYRAYVDLMDHWDKVLPQGRILRVQLEDVLDDPEGQVRRILDYCGLPFDQQCVDFHQTRRAVRTASSEQVRQPINKNGLEQWRPYEAHLAALKLALGPLVPTPEQGQVH